MAVYNRQSPPPSESSNISALAAFGAGNLTGATAAEIVEGYKQTRGRASIGFWTAIAFGGISLIGGNQAVNNANTAMVSANQIVAAAVYSQADMQFCKNALQQLALGVSNATPTGYTNLTSTTQPTATPSTPPPAQNTNTALIVAAAVVVAAVVVAKA